jgi:hypothetical protein
MGKRTTQTPNGKILAHLTVTCFLAHLTENLSHMFPVVKDSKLKAPESTNMDFHVRQKMCAKNGEAQRRKNHKTACAVCCTRVAISDQGSLPTDLFY